MAQTARRKFLRGIRFTTAKYEVSRYPEYADESVNSISAYLKKQWFSNKRELNIMTQLYDLSTMISTMVQTQCQIKQYISTSLLKKEFLWTKIFLIVHF